MGSDSESITLWPFHFIIIIRQWVQLWHCSIIHEELHYYFFYCEYYSLLVLNKTLHFKHTNGHSLNKGNCTFMWFCDCVRLPSKAYISLTSSLFSQVLMIFSRWFCCFFIFFMPEYSRCSLLGTFVFSLASKGHDKFWVVPLVRSVEKM